MEFSRRSFLKVGAAMAAAGAATTMIGCSQGSADTSSPTAAEAMNWTDAADVIIVGSGAAGLAAAVTAKTEFPEMRALVLEAAPFEYLGGNSRVCGQVLHYMDDIDAAVRYLTACNGEYAVEKEYVQAYAEGLVENYDWLTGLGCDLQENKAGGAEFPELDGADHVHQMAYEGKIDMYDTYEGGLVSGTLYGWLYTKALELGCEYLCDTRVVDFVLDDATREIRGVLAEDGRSFKASKGVILACGGFENDMDMLRQCLPIGFNTLYPMGTPYNRGDGLRLGWKMGAQVWHMNNFSGNELRGVVNDDITTGGGIRNKNSHNFIFVGPKGKRFMFEESHAFDRHGKRDMLGGGVYQMTAMLQPAWIVFGQSMFDADNPIFGGPWDLVPCSNETIVMQDNTNEGGLASGAIVKCETIEEVAAATGLEDYLDNLKTTFETYNTYADNNHDLDYKRGQYFYDAGIPRHQEIEAFELERVDPPYYVARLTCQLLNTQGGPKRNEKCEVLDLDGNPIPRLYSAGELGAIFSCDYNGGGNMAENFRTGRSAIRNIALIDSWDTAE